MVKLSSLWDKNADKIAIVVTDLPLLLRGLLLYVVGCCATYELTAMKSDRASYYKHPHFDLMLPSNETLESHVRSSITKRSICHEWPLSCVERIVFEGGQKKYCKTTRAPSREIAAYRSLRSPLLVPVTIIAESENSGVMLLDAFAGGPLTKGSLENGGLASFIGTLKKRLASLDGVGPVFVDLSSVEKVSTVMGEMVARLERRFGAQSSQRIEPELLELAERCAFNPQVQASFTHDLIYSNGDLSADNILVKDGEMRIIDWQFPRIASFDLECVNLCTSLGLDPRGLFPDSVVAASLLCKIRWFAECADVWLPGCDYQGEIVSLIRNLKSLTLGV